ncbi:UDP-glucose 4-epimerase GalE [Atopobacter sp. AH10]|uniref:UDP-glucose 4-epimerase GalE n=1 Tax=Atopobacter sp. AH10 TaxID=2315861 RepID=UPI000EF192B1|nr:UDP-glucose 4-epimerase GalE [Atopobacter sp. AH10]RLK63673.1 UDP-glucose 4-epimerase GalE [Atopobacter sp. AH10]
MKVLVTGGAGYIGSHTVLTLKSAGYDVLIYDNFSNSSQAVLERLEELSGEAIPFVEGDIRDQERLDDLFQQHSIDSVIHFAGLKAVGESVLKPIEYYDNNVSGTVTLLKAMKKAGVKNIVFSSSATVYGSNNQVPFTEGMPTSATNPYGYSKVMIEQILSDVAKSDPEWTITLLRYFNPIGAHKSGRIGELPNGVPNNLMPYITQVAVGKLDHLRVFGNDYDTVDGTGVRDYIHVLDLARGHVKALQKNAAVKGVKTYNLGTGEGVSVLQLVQAFEKYNDIKIPYEIVERRDGDIATCYASCEKAQRELGFTTEESLKDMVVDSWRWQKQNPKGYEQ